VKEQDKPNVRDAAKDIAKKQIARRAIGGAKPAPGGVAKQAAVNLKQAGSSLADGNAVGAAEDTAVAGATIAAAAAGSPAAAMAVNALLNTKAGRSIIRLVLAGVALILVMVFFLISAAASSINAMLNSTGSAQSLGVIDPNGGGLPITDPAQKAEANIIIQTAFDKGYGPDGALVGIIAALAASNLEKTPVSNATPFTPVGVFGMAPFEWAPQFWNGVAFGEEGYGDPEILAKAIAYLEDTNNSASLFFDAFRTHPKLSKAGWEDLAAWDAAKIARESRNGVFKKPADFQEAPRDPNLPPPPSDDETSGDDDAVIFQQNRPNTYATMVYSAQAPKSISSLLTLIEEHPTWKTDYAEEMKDFLLNTVNSSIYFGIGTYRLAPPEERTFFDGPVLYPNTDKALARANKYVGNAGLACSDGMCYRKCDHLAGDIWGYAEASGYATAKIHWYKALATGVARPGNRVPPIGALLFWDSGTYGHVATYIGNGMTVSNLSSGPNGPNVYVVAADYFENSWGSPYLGWAPPIFFNEPPGTALK
jgi:hypothetical protein